MWYVAAIESTTIYTFPSMERFIPTFPPTNDYHEFFDAHEVNIEEWCGIGCQITFPSPKVG